MIVLSEREAPLPLKLIELMLCDSITEQDLFRPEYIKGISPRSLGKQDSRDALVKQMIGFIWDEP